MMMLILALAAAAQEARSLSLADALAVYQDASESLRIAEAGVDRARSDKAAAFGGYLPQVGSAITYSHTFKSEYDGLFDTGTTGTTGATGTTGGTGTGGAAAANPFANLPFGQPDTWRVDFSLSQVVYGGGRVRAQNDLAAVGQELADLGLRSTRAATLLEVASAYLDAQLAAQFLAIAEQALGQAQVTYTHAEAAAKVGRQPEFEVLRARVEADSQRVVVLQQQRYRNLAELRLKQLLGLPAETPLTLTTMLDAEPLTGFGTETGMPLAIRQADRGVSASEAALRLTRSAGLPQVVLSGAGGFVSYPDSPLPPTEDWRTNVSAGATVSMPLFAGGVVRAQIESAKADVTEARARWSQAAEAVDLEIQDALAALATARAQFESTSGTVDQAQRAYAIGEVRFQEGISPQSEVTDARLLLQRALANRAQAGRDLQVASLRLQLLNELPLAAR